MNITRLVVRHVSERRISSARSTATPTPRQYPLGTCKDLRCERRLLRLDLGALQRPRLRRIGFPGASVEHARMSLRLVIKPRMIAISLEQRIGGGGVHVSRLVYQVLRMSDDRHRGVELFQVLLLFFGERLAPGFKRLVHPLNA
jgi:hypothetical protein